MSNNKITNLMTNLSQREKAVVAFSGGVDSAFLAAATYKALGDNAIAVTAHSISFSQQERRQSEEIARHIGIRHQALDTHEFEIPEFCKNGPKRCYYCKKERFNCLLKWANEQGIPWILEGSNVDDLTDYRPGMWAIRELDNVGSPLLEEGFTKQDIRDASREWGLPGHDRPAAACLVSRTAYGLPLNAAVLAQVEQAEAIIANICPGPVRVRHHGEVARIEVTPEAMPALVEQAPSIARSIQALGFAHVALDLQGYTRGSMDATLPEEAKQ